ncbi:hypothetical protein CY34DRAFT_33659, partial [Suillus luteus UH-Slu-Lm8-n1]
RSTTTDLLEVHANILPITLLLQNFCHRSITHISVLPKTHPLYNPIHRAAKYQVSTHRSSFHKLTKMYAIIPENIKTLNP